MKKVTVSTKSSIELLKSCGTLGRARRSQLMRVQLSDTSTLCSQVCTRFFTPILTPHLYLWKWFISTFASSSSRKKVRRQNCYLNNVLSTLGHCNLNKFPLKSRPFPFHECEWGGKLWFLPINEETDIYDFLMPSRWWKPIFVVTLPWKKVYPRFCFPNYTSI